MDNKNNQKNNEPGKKPLLYAIVMFASVVIIYLLLDAFVLTPIIEKIVK